MSDVSRTVVHWAILIAVSVGFAFGLDFVRLPAAFLIGPLVVAIVVRLSGVTLRVPRPIVFSAQAVVGAMIGSTLTPAILTTFRLEWPVLIGVVATTVVVATFSGWLLSRLGVVPGTTGVWGASPGAATAMVILSESHGGDVRLVAFMQYLRVIFVASAASIGARLWIGPEAAAAVPHVFFPALDPTGFAVTVAAIAASSVLGHVTRLPSGAMIGPLFAMAFLNGADLVHVALPPWLLIAAYAGLGWNIGLRFTRASVVHAARALPWIILSIIMLMTFAGCLGLLLVHEIGIDPLTAFLATSPGGLDTVAIIAASSPVDVPFVMSLQALRFFVLVLIGPSLSRFVAARLPRP